jgi:hypothetical protein
MSLKAMDDINENKSKVSTVEAPTLESIAESWVRLCLFQIKSAKKLANHYKNERSRIKAIS